jgi:hypothetical protein
MWFRSFVHLLSCRCGLCWLVGVAGVAVVSAHAVAPCGSVHLFTFFRVVVVCVGWLVLLVLLWFQPMLLPHVVPFICSPSFVSLGLVRLVFRAAFL